MQVAGVMFLDDEAGHLLPHVLYSISQNIDYLLAVARRPAKPQANRLKCFIIGKANCLQHMGWFDLYGRAGGTG
jgi:hypothetical protein